MHKNLISLLALMATATAAPVAAKPNSFAQKDKAGNLLAYLTEGEDLPQKMGKDHFGIPQTGLIYSVNSGSDGVVKMRFAGEGELTRDIALPLSLRKGEKASAWPLFVRLNEQSAEGGYILLLGVVVARSQSYSGGYASEERLRLFRVDNPGADAVRVSELLSLPVAGEKSIRACFTPADEEKRNGACHDSYWFEAHVTLNDTQRGKWPVLNYQTTASASPAPLAWPGQLPDRKLTDEETKRKDDFVCGFRRSLRFNPMSLRYEMEAPGPDCTDYFPQ